MNAPNRLLNSPHRMRLSVGNFILLSDAGAFENYAKSELIDGDIYVMNAQFHPHARAKTELTIALALRLRELGSDLAAVSEVAVRLNDNSMPEPDIVLSAWRGRGPVPVAEVALVVEVSDTTLDTDLGRKAELYAAAGVPEYWVLDLNGGRFVLHGQPAAGGYIAQVEVPVGEPLISSAVEGLRVESGKVLG